MSSKFLLVSRIGPLSLHSYWLDAPDRREFDVLISAYDPSLKKVCSDGLYFEHRTGRKVEGYGAILQHHSDFWKSYDFICFWDEDLEASTKTLNKMFAICAAQNFKIAQPALTLDSHFTYAALLQQRAWRWRYVNYIEMMCPIFRRDILEQISPLYNAGFESGIDLVWCNLVYDSPHDFAVIDATPIRHCEPVGKNKSANGFVDGKQYEDDIYAVLKAYGLPWLSCVPYSAVTASGREVRSRPVLFLAALSVLFSIPLQRPYGGRIRAAFVHLKHLLQRPPRNIKTVLAVRS